MAQKITGVAIQLGNRKWRFSEEAGAPMATEQRATLVVGNERVFTESEVKAMMEDVAHCITWPEAKDVLRRKYNFVLDPA